MLKSAISNRRLDSVCLALMCALVCINLTAMPVAAAEDARIAEVADRAQWDAAFAKAESGEVMVIRIAPGSTIDITREDPWQIPGDVRIEGDGQTTVLTTWAAWDILDENHYSAISALETVGAGVVISGIILRGPLAGTCSWSEATDSNADCRPATVNDSWYSGGVYLADADSRVEYCDISGFIHHGVVATAGTRVYANNIHHNGPRAMAPGADVGYGVAVYGDTRDDPPLIDDNRFSHLQHAIAVPGQPANGKGPGNSYLADNNQMVGPFGSDADGIADDGKASAGQPSLYDGSGTHQLQAPALGGQLTATSAGLVQSLGRVLPGIYHSTPFNSRTHVIKVDLREPGITFQSSGPQYSGKTTLEYATREGMDVAINGDWYNGRPQTPVGNAKTDGGLWHREFHVDWKTLGCNARTECFLEPDVNRSNITNAIGGNVYLLIRDGVDVTPNIPPNAQYYTYFRRTYRTAIGLDRTGRTLILFATKNGENFASTADKMRRLGAHHAMMLDGSISTGMVVRGAMKVSSSRRIGNHVGVRYRTPSRDKTPVDTAVVNNSGARYVVYASGRVVAIRGASHRGHLAGRYLARPIVGMALTPGGRGYWLVASDGGVFAFGNARFYGSMAGQRLNRPVVGMAATPTGRGYWLVASDGGIFAFGDAGFFGSMGGQRLNRPVVGMAATPTGRGYWLVAADGGIFAFGDARFYGSMGGRHISMPVVGMSRSAGGNGYMMVAKDGGIFAFGDAAFKGAGSRRQFSKAVTIAPNGRHYYILDARGGTLCRGECP